MPWRRSVAPAMQTDGRIAYSVALHTQGTCRETCAAVPLCIRSGVLVGVFFANSADKLNIPQPDGHVERVRGFGIRSCLLD